MKRLIYLTALISVFQSVSHAQSNVQVDVNAGLSLIDNSNRVSSFWDSGWRIGGGLIFVVSRNVQLSAEVNYSHFGYSGNGPSLAEPRVIGFRREITGEASTVYQASVGTRLSMSHYSARPFLAIRGGIQSTQVGEIRATEWNDQNPPGTLTTYVYQPSEKSSANPFASIGFGVAFLINSSVSLSVEGALSQTFDGGQLMYPLFTTMQFSL